MKPDQPPRSDANLRADDLRRQAEQAPRGLAAEFFDFVLHNKKWWLIPIVVVLLLVGLLVFLGGSGAAPFIYTLF
ncbi:MAG: hypothetical protein JXB10_07190 [Pirellulales bacterium]|nr:hypothetical protein [Pirellulales bacterium]